MSESYSFTDGENAITVGFHDPLADIYEPSVAIQAAPGKKEIWLKMSQFNLLCDFVGVARARHVLKEAEHEDA